MKSAFIHTSVCVREGERERERKCASIKVCVSCVWTCVRAYVNVCARVCVYKYILFLAPFKSPKVLRARLCMCVCVCVRTDTMDEEKWSELLPAAASQVNRGRQLCGVMIQLVGAPPLAGPQPQPPWGTRVTTT